MKTPWMWVVVGLGVVIVVGLLALILIPAPSLAPACREEAKLCGDGSYVGRTGPKCEFTACPSNSASTTATVRIGEVATLLGVAILPSAIIEDSRCPVDVQCIQAGTVRLFATGTDAKVLQSFPSYTFKLGEPQDIPGHNVSVILSTVTPEKHSTVTIKPSDYRFTFTATKSIPPPVGAGVLSGVMTIGPICPVEQVGHPCLPSPETYAAHKVYVYQANKTTLVATLTPDAEGKFSTALPAGDYWVDVTHQQIGSTQGVPAAIHIAAGATFTISIDVDTGIR